MSSNGSKRNGHGTPNGGPDMNGPDRPTLDDTADADPGYAALLREASGPVPDGHVDWVAFHRTLSARAELSLARLRYPHVAISASATPTRRPAAIRLLPVAADHPWWEPAARWARLVVTASVAAGIILTVIVRMSPKETADTVAASRVVASEQLEGRRAAFESLVTGHTASPTIESAMLPTVTDLLIPLGKGVPGP